MNSEVWKGLSFPLRIGVKGGLALSKADPYDITHIEESITQILHTGVNERVMEGYFGSSLSTYLFEPMEVSTQTLLKYEIKEALDLLEPRIKVEMGDINVTEDDDTNALIVDISFLVVKFTNNGKYTTRITLDKGGM